MYSRGRYIKKVEKDNTHDNTQELESLIFIRNLSGRKYV